MILLDKKTLIIGIIGLLVLVPIFVFVFNNNKRDENNKCTITKDLCSKNLKDYQIIPMNEINELKNNQASFKTCSSLSGIKMLDNRLYRRILLNPYPKVILHNEGADKCLNYEGDLVNMSFTKCDPSGSNEQQLMFSNSQLGSIQNIRGECLTYVGQDNVTFLFNDYCIGTESDKFAWNPETKQIKQTMGNNKCIAYNPNETAPHKQLVLTDCQPNDKNQIWNPTVVQWDLF